MSVDVVTDLPFTPGSTLDPVVCFLFPLLLRRRVLPLISLFAPITSVVVDERATCVVQLYGSVAQLRLFLQIDITVTYSSTLFWSRGREVP